MADFIPHLHIDDVNRVSAVGLAHVGDAVYELMVRAALVKQGHLAAQDLHRSTVRLVKAPAQAEAAARLLPLLNEEEAAVYRRARNAKLHAAPQGASAMEYHAATALEALFGWLYLLGRRERLEELFAAATEET